VIVETTDEEEAELILAGINFRRLSHERQLRVVTGHVRRIRRQERESAAATEVTHRWHDR
jgi:23S rRNA C2498 (ribose-2'-O)-methylase RlmM